MDKNMEKEHITIKLEMFILENGQKIKKMGMEYFNMQVGLFMMVNGLMIELQIKVKLFMQTKTNIKETF
jgi:hypothetical protein